MLEESDDDDLCILAALPELQHCQCSLSCVRLAELQQTKKREGDDDDDCICISKLITRDFFVFRCGK